jgi:phosphopantothenate synthetase
MSLPFNYWLWQLRYSKDKTPPNVADDRMMAAGVLESYRYLIEECTKDEAWRRIKLMRAAIRANPEPPDTCFEGNR